MELEKEIEKLKKLKKAVILAHNYQIMEVQRIADYVGDSLGLARQASKTDARIIVFCGVKFMAETAKILSPDKKVLLPVKDATCPMADMIKPEQLIALKQKHKNAMVCSYVNTNADIKALSDVCCTSANAVQVVNSLPADEVIFVPDRNLGHWVSIHTNKKIHLFDGYCYVHRRFKKEHIEEARKNYPEAKILVHPECDPDVVEGADEVLSTSQMIKYVKNSNHKQYIIGTEEGLIERLKEDFPEKEFYSLGRPFMCYNMKKITLKEVYESLVEEIYEIKIPFEILEKAKKAINEMIKYG